MMVEEIEEQGLKDVPKSEVLYRFGMEEGQENGSRKYSKERMLWNFREIISGFGQFYFQQTRRGRMKMVAMDLVPEYIKRGRLAREMAAETMLKLWEERPGAKNRFDFSVLSNF